MPKKDKQSKEPSEADPRASWEDSAGGVQESEDDKSSKDDKSEPSAQFISSLQSNFQAQLTFATNVTVSRLIGGPRSLRLAQLRMHTMSLFIPRSVT
jgi:hypothetical protein